MSDRRAPDASTRRSGPELVVSPEEERELQAVSRLLQQLPDPEPPEGMHARILDAVALQEQEQEARARHGFRRVAPWAGTALAAGLAAVAVFATLPDAGLPSLSPDPATTLQPSVARPVASATTTGAREEALRRPSLSAVAPVVVARQPADYFGPGPASALPSLDGRPMTLDTARILERRLDHELNHLLLNPASFFDKLARRRDRDRLVAQMARRAAQRGDAVQVALNLRQRAPGHPVGRRITEALLHSAIERDVSRR